MADAPPQNPFFRAVVAVGAVFAVTVMSMLAVTFGDPQAPPNRFFNAYGVPLVLTETLLLVGVSFVALAVDRRQTLAAQRDDRPSDDGPSSVTAGEAPESRGSYNESSGG